MKKIYLIILIILTSIIMYRIYNLRNNEYEKYYKEYLKITNKIVYGRTAPRGRILDRNGNVLVDNIGSNTIFYRNIENNDLHEIATKINEIIIDKTKPNTNILKEYYMNNNDTEHLLTKEEQELFNNRKITIKEKEEIIKSRLDEYINYTEEEQNIIYIYNLLNKGYSYSTKRIKEDVTEQECAQINELNISGLSCEYETKRIYLYDTLNELYGTVGNIPKEQIDYYLEKGYNLNDKVGLSYLEKEYDEYLKGTNAIYKVNEDNTLTLIQEEIPGNDLYLSIDINIQLQINEIIKKYLQEAKKYKNTDYYNTSYVIISDPNTGEILASTGIALQNEEFKDVTSNILTTSYTVGSVIKGASHTVSYQNNIITPDKYINDSCVKLYQVPTKCSYKRLGMINDITALKTSSNYYQFINAIKLTNQEYKYNMKLNVKEEHFNIYRNTFKNFGLGTTTGIDLENESYGITGTKIADDLYLNLSIGQYDTYTPLQLTNYINTIATSGTRYSLHYMKEIKKQANTIKEYEKNILSKIEDNWFFPRIQEGFKEVLYNGTGRGYTNTKYKPAGKTGTSETYYNKDTITINQSYAMFAPYDNPKYTIVAISPNISFNNDNNNYIAPINRLISKEVSNLLFENY